MRKIRVIPEQNGVAIVLTVVALAAIGMTVWRCKEARPVRAMSRSVASEVVQNQTPEVIEICTTPKRNPFNKPTWARQKAGAGAAGDVTVTGAVPMPGKLGSLPMPVQAPGGESEEPDVLPGYTLLTTVTGADKTYAVIKVNESETKVVRTGDMVTDGFRVLEIRTDRAVLSNGTDLIVARRQDGRGSQKTQEQTDGKI